MRNSKSEILIPKHPAYGGTNEPNLKQESLKNCNLGFSASNLEFNK